MRDYDVEIRPPFRLLRAGLGLMALGVAGSLLFMYLKVGPGDLAPLLIAALLAGVGLCGGFLERVVLVNAERRELRVVWRLAGIALHTVVRDVRRAEQVVIATRKEPMIEPVTYAADTSFPVLLRAGEGDILRVIGWGQAKSTGRFTWETSLYSPAFFLSHSRYVAAQLARALRLPLFCETDGSSYPPEAIPSAWLDPKNVAAKLAWRRCGG